MSLDAFKSFDKEYVGFGKNGLGRLFWDFRTATIRNQIVETMANEKEMGMTMFEIVKRINGQRHYEILFTNAFESSEVEEGKILAAIESFMRNLKTSNSKLDKVRRFDASFAESELWGHQLFDLHCSDCHGHTLGQSRVKGKFANNGLEKESTDRGIGGSKLVDRSFDGLFRIPSLRNVALTGPYMHDGRFATLEEVVDFYSEDIQDNQNLHPNLKDRAGRPLKLNFSVDDKHAIVAFLNTLTDMSELGQEKYSDPWR